MNKIKKIFHRHKYEIVGTGTFSEGTHIVVADIICPKCCKCGTILIDGAYEHLILHQAVFKKPLNIPKDAVLRVEKY